MPTSGAAHRGDDEKQIDQHRRTASTASTNAGQGEEKSRTKSVTRTCKAMAGLRENLVDPFEICGTSRIKRESESAGTSKQEVTDATGHFIRSRQGRRFRCGKDR
jgi:hypothetical protein